MALSALAPLGHIAAGCGVPQLLHQGGAATTKHREIPPLRDVPQHADHIRVREANSMMQPLAFNKTNTGRGFALVSGIKG